MARNSGDYSGYSSLGLTTQDVTIFQLPDVAHTGENAYVGILPGGVAFNMNTPNGQGNGVFVINPENGAILSKINTIGQMVVAPLTFVISTSSANKLGGIFISGINSITYTEPKSGSGKIWSVSNGQAECNKFILNKPISKGILAVQEKKTSLNTYLVGGTGSVKGINNFANNVKTTDKHIIFSFRPSVPFAQESNIQESNLTKLSLNMISNTTATTTAVNTNGWYVPLREADSTYKAEEMSTEPYLYQQIVSVATFQAKTTSLVSSFCNAALVNPLDGVSRLYFFDPITGKAGENMLELPHVKVTGIQGVHGKLLVSVQNLEEDALDCIHDSRIQKFDDSSFLIDLPSLPPSDVVIDTPSSNTREFWRTINRFKDDSFLFTASEDAA